MTARDQGPQGSEHKGLAGCFVCLWRRMVPAAKPGEELEMTNTTAFQYRGETANICLVAWVPS
jgi:hypothetical protein